MNKLILFYKVNKKSLLNNQALLILILIFLLFLFFYIFRNIGTYLKKYLNLFEKKI